MSEVCGKVWPENRAVACTRLPGHELADPVCSGKNRITGTRHQWPTVRDDEPADWQQRGWFDEHPKALPPLPSGWIGDPEPLPELNPELELRRLALVLSVAFAVPLLIYMVGRLAGAW